MKNFADTLVKTLLTIVLLIGALVVSNGQHTVSAAGKSGMADHASKHTLNIAHRGASGYAPENTMAAFDKALEMKADYIEIDIQLSRDGEVVLMHDAMVDRTTDGSGRIDAFTLEELKQLDAGSWFGPQYAGEQIPTLEEILDAYRGKTGILIEIKNPSQHPGIEERLAAALEERSMDKPNNGKIIVQSFDHGSIEYFNELLPNVTTGVLVGYDAEGISDEQLAQFSTYADYVNPNHQMVDENLVSQIHHHGMKIAPYTINDQSRINELMDYGVDGIISDYPDLVGHNSALHYN
ncbi:glycerophosphodiester phosphodiesterase [Salinicoccus bachuensis]|uniref:Glycerophosphodiester phosphodiesterase n=1 Tax=Salinicoccus bachuensis TaxID=3136731 RepID=A0ABZ3CHK9_9STAP